MMNPRWQSELDRELERISQETDLPGAGQPLNLTDNSHIPADQRMAYKIMKDHDALPEWVMLNKDLDRQQAQIRDALKRRWAEYRLGIAGAKDDTIRQHVEKVWASASSKLEEQVRAYNDKVLTYNLKVPAGIHHRRLMRFQDELASVRTTSA